jgi:toxin-antitoxin system PIN domain toxin
LIAVDTNILVYAHRADAARHAAAHARLTDLLEGARACAVPWPCVHEFLAVVTHPRIYDPPSSVDQALTAVAAWRESPALAFLGEGQDHLSLLGDLLRAASIRGARVHDARIAAICLAHEVESLWTADRDFSYFPGLRTHNPLVA